MGIIKNIKNLFMDVEEQEVVEEVKEEVKKEEILDEESYLEAESKFRFPVVFSDEDLISDNTLDVTLIHKEPYKKKEQEAPVKVVKEEKVKEKSYTSSKVEKPKAILPENKETTYVKPKKFKPAPAISPVYGLLKNQSKTEEVKEKKPTYKTYDMEVERNLSFDSVRKKAYGNNEDENIFIKETEELLESFENDNLNTPESREKIDDLFTELELKGKELVESGNSTLLDIEKSYNDDGNINNANLDEVDKYLEASFDNNEKEDIDINFFKEDIEDEKTPAGGLADEALDRIIDDEFKTTRESKNAKKKSLKDLDENTVEYELFNLIDTMYENRDKKEGEVE